MTLYLKTQFIHPLFQQIFVHQAWLTAYYITTVNIYFLATRRLAGMFLGSTSAIP